jgi:hypothetical protein
MLQVLHLNISKVDLVLHMGCMWEGEGARAVLVWARDASDVQRRSPRVAMRYRRGQATSGPREPMRGRREMDCSHGCPDAHLDARSVVFFFLLLFSIMYMSPPLTY